MENLPCISRQSPALPSPLKLESGSNTHYIVNSSQRANLPPCFQTAPNLNTRLLYVHTAAKNQMLRRSPSVQRELIEPHRTWNPPAACSQRRTEAMLRN